MKLTKKIILSFIIGIIFILGIYAIFPKKVEKDLDQKIGQMICLDFRNWKSKDSQSIEPVTEINDEIKEIIAKYHIGAVVLFGENFENEEQAKKLTNDLQKAAKDAGNPPLIIAVDQEGGLVERFSFGRERLKDNEDIKSSEEAFEKGTVIGKELKELGINCDFAPVVDVNSNPDNPVIGCRSFSEDPNVVAEFGTEFLNGLHSNNIMATAKHFPGHGDTNTDSHYGLPKVEKTLEEIERTELIPFQKLIERDVDLIMTAHIEFPEIEKEMVVSQKDGKKIYLPATLSRTILTDILRKKMGFNGIITTDAMDMKAISENFGPTEAANRAISAGADMICMPVTLREKSDVTKLDELFASIKSAVNAGEISEEQINDSVERIIKCKEKYCVEQ